MKGKKLLSLIIMLIAVSIMIYGCGSSDSSNIKTSEVALSEYTFKDDPKLHAQFSHVTVVDFEHAQESNINEKDSLSPGVDMIPFTVRQEQTYGFQFEDIGNGPHYAILLNEDEEEVARIEANGTPVEVFLTPGKYNLYLYNMGTETFPLFLQPFNGVEASSAGNEIQVSYNPLSVAWFAIWFSCASCNLSYANLSNHNWMNEWTGGGAYLYKANLSHANLENTVLDKANLSYANLSYANLEDSSLDYANLTHADLSHADLILTFLEGSDLTGAYLSYATFRSYMPYAWLSSADLSYADLSFSDMSFAKLAGANMANASLEATQLTHATLIDANMTNVDLVGAELTLADLTGADLTGADLEYANLLGATLTGATLSGARFGNATWIDGRTCGEESWGRCDFE